MQVALDGITKRFGELRAVDAISLTIDEGDFYTLLGPSGCGKTTLLRTIAGFYSPDEGTIRFGAKVMNHIPAHRRETGMVFQNYALFPHLSVFDNIAYGLRARKVSATDIRARVAAIIASVQLGGMEDRSPAQLSGGQQQRVALARALVISPQVLLMDEPLSNLDAKLRVSMREEIRRIQRQMGITTIYVTHDQEEAMAVSNHIAILNRGRVEQQGTPQEIYMEPVSRFVAEFMGSSNTVEASVTGYDADKGLIRADIAGEALLIHGPEPTTPHLIFSLRPERISLVDDGARAEVNVFAGTVTSATFLGSLMRYRVKALGGQSVMIEVHDPHATRIHREGDPVRFHFDPDRPVILADQRS